MKNLLDRVSWSGSSIENKEEVIKTFSLQEIDKINQGLKTGLEMSEEENRRTVIHCGSRIFFGGKLC